MSVVSFFGANVKCIPDPITILKHYCVIVWIAAKDNVAALLRCVVILVQKLHRIRKLEERRNAFGQLPGWSTRRLGQSCPVPKVPCNSVSVSIISKGKQEHGKGTNLKHLNGRTEQEMSSEAGPMSQ